MESGLKPSQTISNYLYIVERGCELLCANDNAVKMSNVETPQPRTILVLSGHYHIFYYHIKSPPLKDDGQGPNVFTTE